jgi:hypothetical protein
MDAANVTKLAKKLITSEKPQCTTVSQKMKAYYLRGIDPELNSDEIERAMTLLRTHTTSALEDHKMCYWASVLKFRHEAE